MMEILDMIPDGVWTYGLCVICFCMGFFACAALQNHDDELDKPAQKRKLYK